MNKPAEVNIQLIDIEEYSKSGKAIPKGQKYLIKVDKEHFEVETETLFGREILTLAGKTPVEKFMLKQKKGATVVDVGLNQSVDLTEPGVERFMTIPNEVTEGEAVASRVGCALTEDDRHYLDRLGLPWEAVQEGEVRRVVIHGWDVPAGYNVQSVSVHVRLESGYPDTQIDMAYFHPSLARIDGRGINNLTTENFNDLVWQRWSRHRTAASTWRIGVDNLETHMALVTDWLEKELAK